MKWKDLTPDQLRHVATDIADHAHDMKFEQEIIEEEAGFDVVVAYEALVRRLRREAERRARGPKRGLAARYKALSAAAIAVANDCDSAEDVTPAIVRLRRVLAGATP